MTLYAFIIHRLNDEYIDDEYITLVFAVPGSLLLQNKANPDTFSVKAEASSFQSFGTPRGNLCYGLRHLINEADDWSKVC